jgi:subtilisin family serine protease
MVAVVSVLVSASIAAAATHPRARETHLGTHTSSPRAHASAVPAPVGFLPNRVLVGFRPRTTRRAQRDLERALGARSLGPLTLTLGRSRAVGALRRRVGPSFLLAVAPGRVTAVVRAFRRHWAVVRYAEPDYVMRGLDAIPAAHIGAREAPRVSASSSTSAPVLLPNDPSFGLQWGSYNTGQQVNGTTGTAGADDGAARAWSTTTGSRSIVIGEVDTGVDYTHPDLVGNIWTNPGGIGGCAAGTHGYNVISSTCDPMDDDTQYGGHGTHVAGIMGATGNNGTGVAGMNWQTTILPVKWVASDGSASTSDLISALNWLLQAKQAGVNIRVINDSPTFVGTAFSQALSDEIDTLGANNILFVTAAGNTGQDNDNLSYRRYPCGYDRPTELCVTASDQNNALPSWANYGASTVQLAAPGNNIYSTLLGHSYGYIDGGSMASAQVSGAAALVLSAQDMTTSALRQDILSNVHPVAAFTGKVSSGGILDVCAALPGCSSSSSAAPASTGAPQVSGTPQVGQVLSATEGSWSGSPSSFAYAWSRCSSAGCSAISGAAGATYQVVSGDVGDTLEVTVTASNSTGSTSATSQPTAVVVAAPSSSQTTLGNSVVGSGWDSFAANRKRVNVYALSGQASLSKLEIYLSSAGGSGTADLEGVIYADSGGAPGALIAVSGQLAYSGSAAGWYALPFASQVTLSAGTYWIGVITGGSGGVAAFRYSSVSGSRDYNNNSYSSGPSNPFGSSFSTDSEQMSLYAPLS